MYDTLDIRIGLDSTVSVLMHNIYEKWRDVTSLACKLDFIRDEKRGKRPRIPSPDSSEQHSSAPRRNRNATDDRRELVPPAQSNVWDRLGLDSRHNTRRTGSGHGVWTHDHHSTRRTDSRHGVRTPENSPSRHSGRVNFDPRGYRHRVLTPPPYAHRYRHYIRNYRRPMNFKKPDFEMYDEENGDPYTHLFYYRESIRDFRKRFQNLLNVTDPPSDKFIIQAFKDAIGYDRSGLYNSLTRQLPFSKSELFDHAEEFARVEDDLKARQLREENLLKNKKESRRNFSNYKGQDRTETSRTTSIRDRTPSLTSQIKKKRFSLLCR
ncbi:hypothetical protein IFM89_006022 [Coptis chinensis]|uniref:Uncharacterized protein n=1 Tax=Coptis chinensis TaxID=261450 RepID=A0A835LUM1_9MAGN|nr:hypothetical protein IFM89_006022 [Coptis chinensis]